MSPENQHFDAERRQTETTPANFALPEEFGKNSVTGLPDRLALDYALMHAADTMPGQFALVAGDIDGLKRTNDTEGHERGNELLRAATTALNHELREDDQVAVVTHPGGDEISFLLGNIENDEQVAAVIHRLQTKLDEQGIRISMGGRMHRPGEALQDLVNDADEQTYANKVERKLAAYTPEQRELMRKIGEAASAGAIDLRDIPLLLPHL